MNKFMIYHIIIIISLFYDMTAYGFLLGLPHYNHYIPILWYDCLWVFIGFTTL